MAHSEGISTFLFTDIEGSTKLWEADPKLMELVLARHDALMRGAIEAHGGYVFKTVGDAFCAAFPDAGGAVAAAVKAQHALNDEPWPEACVIRVRMALHSGEAQRRDADYFGRTLNRVARILGTGHGGQILLSSSTKALCDGALPDGCSTTDLGEHRLKDLGRPVHLYQLSHIELTSTHLPLRSLESNQHNLPLQLTSFIGRDRELAEALEIMQRTRLLTLTGSGGCGKTRLALHLAAGLVEDSPDGVWFVELAPINDLGQIPHAVAGVVGVRDQPGMSITQALIESLADRRMVLLLDNCEHVIEACAKLAHDILVRCPQVSILATSREPLGIAGEQSYRVPSLSVPSLQPGTSLESMQQFESVGLFVERAQSHRTDLSLDDRNVAAIASVCQRLDGIPLAIELAAARVRTMTVEEIDQRLDQRFRLLTGGSRAALPRQQTLRSLVDWSYDLLTPREQSVLRRISAFSGGWTLAAAESVCQGDDLEDWEVADLLSALVQKSLVIADLKGEASRYGLLQTVRQYASDRLSELGNEQVYDRHLAYFVQVAEESRKMLTGPETHAALARLDTEYDNIRTALTWACKDANRARLGVQLAGQIWRYWFIRGRLSEGRTEFRAVLDAAPEEDSADRALALHGATVLAIIQADHANARRLAQMSIGMWQRLGDVSGEANALNALANLEYEQGHFVEAKELYEKGLVINRALGVKTAELASLANVGIALMSLSQLPEAREALTEAVALCREIGANHYLPSVLGGLVNVKFEEDDYEGASLGYPEVIALNRELGDKRNLAQMICNYSASLVELGRLDEVLPGLEESIKLTREMGDKRNLAAALHTHGGLDFARDDMSAALAHCAQALVLLTDGDGSLARSCLRLYACASVRSGQAELGARIFGATLGNPAEFERAERKLDDRRCREAIRATREALGDRFGELWAEGAATGIAALTEEVVSKHAQAAE